jgi:hypothetical protein
MASGGMRETAGQNNFGVSATGGNGSAGNKQPARYAAGIDNAEDFFDLQTQADVAQTQTVTSPTSNRSFMAPSTQPLVPLDAPTMRPDEDVRMGATMGQETMFATDAIANEEDAARLRSALPAMTQLAELPSASNAYRNYVRYLRSVL